MWVPPTREGLGAAFARQARRANTFSKIARYEAALDRSWYRALRELQRLQAARRAVLSTDYADCTD